MDFRKLRQINNLLIKSNKIQINCNEDNIIRTNFLKTEWISLKNNLEYVEKLKIEINQLENNTQRPIQELYHPNNNYYTPKKYY